MRPTCAAFLLLLASCAHMSDDCAQSRTCNGLSSSGSSSTSSTRTSGTAGATGQAWRTTGGTTYSGVTSPSTGGISSNATCNVACGGDTPICDPGTRQCVACTSDAHCGGAAPLCDSATHACIGCTDDSHCTSPTPACDTAAQSCVPCMMDAHCSVQTPACSVSTASSASNLCVECTTNDHCADTPSTPRCKTDATKCVRCLASIDCTGKTTLSDIAGTAGAAGASGYGGAPGVAGTSSLAGSPQVAIAQPRAVCDPSINACVDCLANADCASTPGTPVCNTATKSCVECLSNAECKFSAASRCDTEPTSPTVHTCRPCSGDNDCSQIAGKSLCDTGTCVQCTGKRYDTCGKLGDKQLVCDSQQFKCSADKTSASATLCQACISDAECKPGQLCARQKFEGLFAGYFCFWKEGDTANGAPADCFEDTDRPYSNTEVTTSIDRQVAILCTLRTSTCKARYQWRATDCAPSGMPNDAACGVLPGRDSKCVQWGSSYRCTMACLDETDCPWSASGSPYLCFVQNTQAFCSLDK